MIKINRLMTMIILLTIMSLCSNCYDEGNGITSSEGERVFYNGKIYTVNSNEPWAEAMFVKDGIIEYVGSNTEAQNLAPESAELIDLGGTFVMPGIHDVHLHPLEAASENFNFIVDENEENPENYATDIQAAMQQNPGDGWLLGWGHFLGTSLNANRPPKEIIDDVAPNRPVAIMEQTSHSIWCNSKALELMGITDETENPIGGIIMREANGEANGILIDNAGNLLIDLALAPTTERAENDYWGLIEYALPEMAKYGITSVSDARTYWKRGHQDTWKRIANEDKLTARVNLGLWAYPTEEDASQIETLKSLYQNDANSLLKINQIKLYSDGIIHNTTCAMHANYLIDYFNMPNNNGINYFTQERMATYIAELESTGFDFHIHAIGNRGVHESLNAIEQNGTSNGRHRLTHVEYVDAVDIPRFAALNVTADAQVAGDFTQPEYWHENDYLIGSTLNNNVIPIKSLKDANARVTLSSDWDVSDLNPFIGMQNAVTRIPQNISLADAIEAYTINAAYVMRQENIVGTLEEGKEADFIILDRNIFEIPVNQINQTKVNETYLQGGRVFKR